MVSRYDQRMETARQEATAELIGWMRDSLRELNGRYTGKRVWLGNTYSFSAGKRIGDRESFYLTSDGRIVENYITGSILGILVKTADREVSPDEIPFEKYETSGFIRYIAEQIDKAQKSLVSAR